MRAGTPTFDDLLEAASVTSPAALARFANASTLERSSFWAPHASGGRVPAIGNLLAAGITGLRERI
jgi:hypothetical protein